MWIKHNNALYNSNEIVSIRVARTSLKAKFKDGTEESIGSFKNTEDAKNIFRSVSQGLLFENENHPGIIIKDTKVQKEK